jgi:hypothetical protein
MKKFTTYVACLLIAILPGCSLLTPEQRANARQQIQMDYEAGLVSQADRDAAFAALDRDEPVDWGTLAGTAASAVIAALTGVRIWRGPSTQKVGLPASKVKQV